MKTPPKYLQNHSMFSVADYEYLSEKGYTNKEIKALWERDAASGCTPCEHPSIVDVVGYLSK